MSAITDEYNVLEGKYVFYYSRYRKFFEDFKNQMNGIIGGVSTNKFSEILFPLAPLPFQRAIVSKTEEIFSDLDNGIANFKKAQEQLKIYRQAVLKKAFEGELTKEWREKQSNLPTAEELLKQIKEERQNHYNQQIEDWKKAVKEWEKNGKVGKKPSKPTQPKELPAFTDDELEELPELPLGWSWCKNENYLFEVKDGTHDTPKYLSDGIPFITQKNIKNNSIDFSNVSFISENDHERFYKRSNVENGDIIIAMIGHGRGNSCLVKTDKVFSIKNVGLFKFFKNIQSNRFSLNYYQSTLGLNLILKSSKGGAQPFIGLTELRNWAVPVCSLQEQTQIVQEIESRLSVCDKMEQSISESLGKAEALRQSILKKAFEGKLLSEVEIEQCKQAADYEPASELLKKIKAEKLAKEQEQKKTTTKKKSKK
ncbi:MAG: restriction endonuclease subunit S [Bacteroidales bacterium]|nr:restriction endonuclease subunit S [Bacteroidales bacterium]